MLAPPHQASRYAKHAWGEDEIGPSAGRGARPWVHLAVTMLDSLSTLWVMGLTEEFDAAEECARGSVAGRYRSFFVFCT